MPYITVASRLKPVWQEMVVALVEEILLEANQYHDERGRFTSKGHALPGHEKYKDWAEVEHGKNTKGERIAMTDREVRLGGKPVQLTSEMVERLQAIKQNMGAYPALIYPPYLLRGEHRPSNDFQVVAVWLNEQGKQMSGYPTGYKKAADGEKFKRIDAMLPKWGAIAGNIQKLASATDEQLDAFIKAGKLGIDRARARDAAQCLYLMASTGIRVGSQGGGGETMVREKGKLTGEAIETFGATGLQKQHVKIDADGKGFSFDFTGKRGMEDTRRFKGEALTKMLQSRMAGKRPGDSLFDTEPGKLYSDVKNLWELCNGGASTVVHDIRELKATRMAHDLVQTYNPTTAKEAERARREISEEVGRVVLNDTSKMMAAKAYISPTVFGRWSHLGLEDVKRG